MNRYNNIFVYNVLAVPNIALKFTPKTDRQKYKNQGFWVKNGLKPERIDITTGASDDSYTEVQGEGIYESKKILIGMKGGKNKKKRRKRPPRLQKFITSGAQPAAAPLI